MSFTRDLNPLVFDKIISGLGKTLVEGVRHLRVTRNNFVNDCMKIQKFIGCKFKSNFRLVENTKGIT